MAKCGESVRIRSTDIIVDNTILTSVAQCHTQAALRHVLGLTTKDETKELRAGQAVHVALAWWLCQRPVSQALEQFDAHYRQWATAHVSPDDRLAWKPVRRILRRWLESHPLESWQLVVKPEEVEVPITATLGIMVGSKLVDPGLRIDGPRVVMVALLDAIGKQRTGGRWSIDHKTTGNLNEWFKRRQEDSSQFTGQMWVMRENRIAVSGIFINGIELSNIPGSDRRCAKHGVSYKECGVTHPQTMLFPVTRTPHEIETWALTARGLARQFIRLQERVSTTDDVRSLPMQGRFTGACNFCQFRDWCRLGRPAGATKTFVVDQWSPLEHAQRHVDALVHARVPETLTAGTHSEGGEDE